MDTTIKQFQEEIAGILNSDEWFGQHDINWLPEDTLNVEYEIKKNLGQTGMVAVVTTPSLDYQGEHKSTATVKNYTETKDGNTTVWTVPDEQGRNIEVTQVKTVTPTKPYDEILEYVEFAGEPGYGEQYIDTGLTVKDSTRVEIEYASVNPPASQQYYMLGAFESSKGFFVSNIPNSISVQIGSQPKSFSLGGATDGFVVVDLSNRMASINGTVQTYTVTPQPTTGTMLIGAARLNGNVVQPALRAKPGVRFKSCKIYDAGILVRDFVAAKKNGVACLFDKVSGQLYYNANQGGRDFTAGPTVEVAPTTVTYAYTVAGGCIPSGLDFTVTPGQTREEIVGDSRYETLLTMDGDTVPTSVSISKESGGTIGKPYEKEVEWLENDFIDDPPYDAEVEYIESTGTQWIDTGLTLTPDSRCEISLAADWNPSTTIYLFGPSAPNGRFVFGRGYANGTNATMLYFGLGTQNYVSNVSFDSLGTELHSYFIDAATKTAGVDGKSFSLTSAGDISGTPAICMLCQIQNNRGFMKAKLYAARYWQNGVLVRDFIPVRVGSVGYLFDTVSRQLYGNAGEGSFVLGPDTQTYDRRSYIDTGINGSSDLNVEVTVAKMPVPTTTDNNATIGCSRINGSNEIVALSYLINTQIPRYGYDDYNNNTYFKLGEFPLTVGIVDATATLNGVSYKSVMSNTSFSNSVPFTLFAFNSNGSKLGTCKVAISRCKMWTSSEQLRDMIPVVAGGEPAFYDKINDQLFYNQGLAPFTVGPDCTPQTTTDSSAATFTDDVEQVNKGFDATVSLQIVENPTVNRGKPDKDHVATALDVAHRAVYTLAGYDTDGFNSFSPSTIRQSTVAGAGNKLLQVDARFTSTPVL